jgi:hypothetical protein
MKKTLEEAIGQLRELPEDQQEAAAEVVFAYVSSDERQYHLLPHQIKEVRRIQKGLRDGTGRLASDEEVEAFKEKVGL